MEKLERLKQAIKNPPAERLAKIEYRSYFLNILGTLIVSVILIAKGYWYIIFAFIFTLGASYSQAMTALQKYKMITRFSYKPRPEDFEEDISPSRKRQNIIKYVMKGDTIVASTLAVVSSAFIINPLHARWYMQIVLLVLIFAFYIFYYFFVLYWITYPIYKKKMKGGNIDYAKN